MDRLALGLAVALLAAGCADLVPVGRKEPLTVWEAGLATWIETPPNAPTRSDAERRAGLEGAEDPASAAFDAAVEAWMARYGIPAGQIALMHDGTLRHERGFGHVDAERTRAADEATMFRVASITKPMTAAVVATQIELGLYAADDRVFCLGDGPAPGCRLSLPPHPGRPVRDARLADATVAQLLDHTAGWGHTGDRWLHGEGVVAVADALGVPTPPPAWRTAQFLLGEELAHDPGAREEYCNVCYLLLGLVAESASGATMEALYDAYLFRPLEVEGDIAAGRTRPHERDPREPFYACEGGPSRDVFTRGTTDCPADAAFDLEGILALAGLVATASAVAAVYEVHESVFAGAIGPIEHNGHGGALPGTSGFVRTVEGTAVGEVQYAVLFDKGAADEAMLGRDVYDLDTAVMALALAWAASSEARTND